MVEWPPIGKIAAHSACGVFSWYKYLIVEFRFFSNLGFGVGIFFWLHLFLVVAFLYLNKTRLTGGTESEWYIWRLRRRFGMFTLVICRYSAIFEPHREKTGFSLGENKGADQLRSNCEAVQRLCFRYTDGTISLLLKSEISSFLPTSVTVQVGFLASRLIWFQLLTCIPAVNK